jgi:hypothetical protein
MVSQRLALLTASSLRFVFFFFLGGVFKARLLIIDTARFESVVDFDDTVEGVDGTDGDLRCLRSGVFAAGRASVDFPFGALVFLPFCCGFLEFPSFDFLEDVDFDFLVVLVGEAIGFFFFVVLVMIGFGILLLFK